MLLLAALHLLFSWPALVAVELALDEALGVVAILLSALSAILGVFSLIAEHNVASAWRAQVPALDVIGPVARVEVVEHNYGRNYYKWQ